MSANNANSFGEVKKEDKSANKKIVFDSKDIDKKEKTDFFVRVEGAEERKKAVIRRMQQQKDELIREQKAKEAAIKKDEKMNRRQARRQKIANTFWNGNRKAITFTVVFLVLLFAIGGPFFWKGVIDPLLARRSEQAEREEITEKTNAAVSKQEEANKNMEEKGYTAEAYEEAKNSFEKEIDSATDNTARIEYVISYADFVYDIEGDPVKSANIILENEKYLEGTPDSVRCGFYVSVRTYFTKAEDQEKIDYYNDKVNEYLPKEPAVIPEEVLREITGGQE